MASLILQAHDTKPSSIPDIIAVSTSLRNINFFFSLSFYPPRNIIFVCVCVNINTFL